jgi:phosphopantetheinyl transferase (holo-ACP synthase)
LIKDNLRIDDNNPTRFTDTKYGFQYPHEVLENLEDEYETIRQKYFRRIAVFREAVTHPTVFFRCVRNQKEIDYINQNWEYAEALLKSFCAENRVIYVLFSGLQNLTDKVEAYQLDMKQCVGKYQLRHLFDTSEELLDLCTRLIGADQMQKNKEFDRSANGQTAVAGYIRKCAEEDVDGVDRIVLDTMDASVDEGIYIWGAGHYGTLLARYLRKRNVAINGIIDNNYLKKTNEEFEVIPFDAVEDGAKIFIAISKKESNIAIERQIRSRHRRTTIVKFSDLVNAMDWDTYDVTCQA